MRILRLQLARLNRNHRRRNRILRCSNLSRSSNLLPSFLDIRAHKNLNLYQLVLKNNHYHQTSNLHYYTMSRNIRQKSNSQDNQGHIHLLFQLQLHHNPHRQTHTLLNYKHHHRSHHLSNLVDNYLDTILLLRYQIKNRNLHHRINTLLCYIFNHIHDLQSTTVDKRYMLTRQRSLHHRIRILQRYKDRRNIHLLSSSLDIQLGKQLLTSLCCNHPHRNYKL